MRARLRRKSRRYALCGLAFLLLPVGLAHLATNAVPVTYAGVANQPISMPTTLSLEGAKVNVAQDDYYQFTNLKATLSFNGNPVDGATVAFKVAGVPVCTQTTKNNGDAICPSSDQIDRSEFPDSVDPTTFEYVAVVTAGPLAGLQSLPAQLEKQTGAGSS